VGKDCNGQGRSQRSGLSEPRSPSQVTGSAGDQRRAACVGKGPRQANGMVGRWSSPWSCDSAPFRLNLRFHSAFSNGIGITESVGLDPAPPAWFGICALAGRIPRITTPRLRRRIFLGRHAGGPQTFASTWGRIPSQG